MHVQVTAQNYDKYGSRNPIVVHLMRGFISSILHHLKQLGSIKRVIDVGCGEGHMTSLIRLALPDAAYFALDTEQEFVAHAACAAPDITFLVADAHSLPFQEDSFDLALGIEMLEHTSEPDRVLSEMARVSNGHVLVSVPREPLWRLLNLARGAYLRSFGNTPGHIQHWTAKGFRRLLERHLDVLTISQPIPWLMASCQVRGHDSDVAERPERPSMRLGHIGAEQEYRMDDLRT